MTEYFRVGVITSTHGLRGEVKVFPTTDDPSRFLELKEVLLFPPEDGRTGSGKPAGGQGRSNASPGKPAGDRGTAPETAEAGGGRPLRTLEIEKARFFKQLVILKFRGLDRIEDVERLGHYCLYVTRENATPLEEGEYYIADLIGLQVEDENGAPVGTLTEVITTGANDVYVVEGPEREILIPAIRDCILEVDIIAGKMRVHLLKGL